MTTRTTQLHSLVENSRRLAKSSKGIYLADLDRWIAFAGTDPKRWTRYRAQEFYDQLITVDGLKPQSATRLLMSLRYAAQRWAQMESKPELDFTQIELAKDKRRERREALTVDQATKLLRSVDQSPEGLRDFAFFVVELETGMRRMSSTAMLIEKTGRSIATSASGAYPATMVPIKGRGDDLWAIPLSDTAMLAIEPWVKWLKRFQIKKGPIFRTVLYSPIDKTWRIRDRLPIRTLHDIVVQRSEAAGIGHVHPHIFRHTFISWRLQASVPPIQISAITLHRLGDDGLGALYDYTDKTGQIAQLARAHTPEWLAALVKERCS